MFHSFIKSVNFSVSAVTAEECLVYGPEYETLSTRFRCFPFPSVSTNAPPLGSEALLQNDNDDDRIYIYI